jgi:exosortase/archaeosortase family protein
VIQIGSRQTVVDPPCAGLATLALALTSSLVFLVLFPIRRRWFVVVALLAASLLIAFLFNTFRVMVLSLSSKQCDAHWWTSYCGFEFWHKGTGSHLFTLLAVSGVCLLWWWTINRHDPTPAS